jgi:peptidoglycan-associated lipoprotein
MLNRKLELILAAALCLALGGCSSGGETKAAVSPPAVNALPPPAPPPAPPPPPPQPDLSQHSVYFDFDQSGIKPEGQQVIANWASYLLAHPTMHARVEGNCDERGTREYNIGLGERRANAVANALEAKGVAAAQLDIISYGKEHPVAPGHDEQSWARNRRADLVQR